MTSFWSRLESTRRSEPAEKTPTNFQPDITQLRSDESMSVQTMITRIDVYEQIVEDKFRNRDRR